jgi:L-fuculose-phosphate aldolase
VSERAEVGNAGIVRPFSGLARMAAMPHSAAPSDLTAARATLVAAGRRLGARGHISAGEGNLSVRIDDAWLLMTPSGRRKDELDPADLVVVATEQGADRGAASSDIAIHRAVYAARPDVLAVVHAHLPAAMALTLAGEIPDPSALPETALFLPTLPYIRFATPGSPELAAAIGAAFARGPEPLPGAVLLERHGAVAAGTSLTQAVDRLELVEVLCRTSRDSLVIRAAAAQLGRDRGAPS